MYFKMQRISGLQLNSLNYVAMVEMKRIVKDRSKKMFPAFKKMCVCYPGISEHYHCKLSAVS